MSDQTAKEWRMLMRKIRELIRAIDDCGKRVEAATIAAKAACQSDGALRRRVGL